MENLIFRRAKSVLSERTTVDYFMFSSWPWSNAIEDSRFEP